MYLIIPKWYSAAAVHHALLLQSCKPAQTGERLAKVSTGVQPSSPLGLAQARKKSEFSPKRRVLWAEPDWEGRQGAKPGNLCKAIQDALSRERVWKHISRVWLMLSSLSSVSPLG